MKDYLRLIPRNDVTQLFADHAAFADMVDDLLDGFAGTPFDFVAGIDALGFILGAAMALKAGGETTVKHNRAVTKQMHLGRAIPTGTVMVLVLILALGCQSAEPVGPYIDVPRGAPATIDGSLSPGEWENAYLTELSNGSALRLMHDGMYVYIGLVVKPDPVTSICVDRGDQVNVFHSSAALGTIVFQDGGSRWDLVREPAWSCRDVSDSASALAARQAHLDSAGWLASNGNMGVTDEVEFQIALADEPLRLAIAAIGSPDYETVLQWPVELADGCVDPQLLRGPMPEQTAFSPEQWITLKVSE